MTITTNDQPQIGRVRIEGFVPTPAPDLSNSDVVAKILSDAKKVSRRESAFRRGQRKFRAA